MNHVFFSKFIRYSLYFSALLNTHRCHVVKYKEIQTRNEKLHNIFTKQILLLLTERRSRIEKTVYKTHKGRGEALQDTVTRLQICFNTFMSKARKIE